MHPRSIIHTVMTFPIPTIRASILFLMVAIATLVLPRTTQADPADISAAARGVVRVVIIGSNGDEVYPISHGSGFAVSPTRIVTNAHVVLEAQQDTSLRIGIVPSDGEDASYARIIEISQRNDLALLEITDGLRLPPLTVASSAPDDGARDSGEVTSVGYPMNVDRAQGLEIGDIFKPQPPVTSRGFLSGSRPSRQFDTILHTAAIARGNSGGPLLDSCGRVLGVNSFGADTEGSDGEFYFAVSTPELLPFLRANGVQPRTNSMPCRSLADIDAQERERMNAQQSEARRQMADRAGAQRDKRARVQLETEQAVQEERENAMALAALLLLLAIGAGTYAAWNWRRGNGGSSDWEDGEVDLDAEYHSAIPASAKIAAIVSVAALIGALVLWFTRPGLDAIDRRVTAVMGERTAESGDSQTSAVSVEGALLCTLDPSRSRIVGAPEEELAFGWQSDGCVNGRTQYGLANGSWSRVFVPDEEDAVSVNIYDADTRTFRTDRYLLGRSAIAAARAARAGYKTPQCNASGAAASLGERQTGVTALLPDSPNERLVYQCEVE